MLRYPAPKTGLGIGHLVSQIRIDIIRSFESFFKEVSLIQSLKKAPASLKRYPEIEWLLDSAAHIFSGAYPIFASTRCDQLLLQAKLMDQYALLSEQGILSGSKETLLILRRMEWARIVSALYLKEVGTSLYQARKTNAAVDATLWAQVPLFREMLFIEKKVGKFLEDIEVSAAKIEDFEELRYLREILALVIRTAAVLISNHNTRDIYGSLQNIALCMGFCGDAEYLYGDLLKLSVQMREKRKHATRKAIQQTRIQTTRGNSSPWKTKSIEWAEIDSQYPVLSKWEQRIFDRLATLDIEVETGKILWIKSSRQAKMLSEILILEKEIAAWDQKINSTHRISALIGQIRTGIYTIEVQSRVSEIVDENSTTSAEISTASSNERSDLQKQWLTESRRLIQITRTVTSSKKNSQLQRDSYADGHFVTDFLHPFLRFMITQLGRLPTDAPSFDMREVLNSFYQNTAQATQQYTHTMLTSTDSIENTRITEAADIRPLLLKMIIAYRQNWMKDSNALLLLMDRLG